MSGSSIKGLVPICNKQGKVIAYLSAVDAVSVTGAIREGREFKNPEEIGDYLNELAVRPNSSERRSPKDRYLNRPKIPALQSVVA